MPFALLLVGAVFVITGARDTYQQFFAQVGSDLKGQGGFLYWMVALFMAGTLGYVDKMRAFSVALMTLIVISLFLAKGKGLFDQIGEALQNGPIAPKANTAQEAPSSGTSNGGWLTQLLGVPSNAGPATTATTIAGNVTGIHVEPSVNQAVQLLGTAGGL